MLRTCFARELLQKINCRYSIFLLSIADRKWKWRSSLDKYSFQKIMIKFVQYSSIVTWHQLGTKGKQFFVKKVEPAAFFSIGFSTKIGNNRLHILFGTYKNEGPGCKLISSSKRCVLPFLSSFPSLSLLLSSATMESSVGECHPRMRNLH